MTGQVPMGWGYRQALARTRRGLMMIDEALDGGFNDRWRLPAGRNRGERARPAAPLLLSLCHSRGSVALAMPATNHSAIDRW